MSKSNQILPKPLYEGRLLKSALMEFPEGSYLLSNICDAERVPIIEGEVPSMEHRENAWKKIKLAKADGRLCRVFKNRMDCESYEFELWKIQSDREFRERLMRNVANRKPYESFSGE